MNNYWLIKEVILVISWCSLISMVSGTSSASWKMLTTCYQKGNGINCILVHAFYEVILFPHCNNTMNSLFDILVSPKWLHIVSYSSSKTVTLLSFRERVNGFMCFWTSILLDNIRIKSNFQFWLLQNTCSFQVLSQNRS
jgi:hypothetical protein